MMIVASRRDRLLGDPGWGLVLLGTEEKQVLLCGDQGGDFRKEMPVAASHVISLTTGS